MLKENIRDQTAHSVQSNLYLHCLQKLLASSSVPILNDPWKGLLKTLSEKGNMLVISIFLSKHSFFLTYQRQSMKHLSHTELSANGFGCSPIIPLRKQWTALREE